MCVGYGRRCAGRVGDTEDTEREREREKQRERACVRPCAPCVDGGVRQALCRAQAAAMGGNAVTHYSVELLQARARVCVCVCVCVRACVRAPRYTR